MDNKKVVLFSFNFAVAGGAERLLLEHAKFLRRKNYDVYILSFNFNETVLFNNSYENKNIYQICKNHNEYKLNYYEKIKRLYSLRKKIQEISPAIILGQHYVDCSILYIATLFSKYKYSCYIHGTIMWFVEDYKYSLLFKRSFLKLRELVPGHKEFYPKEYQKKGIVSRVKNTILSLFNYLGVRKALSLFSLTDTMANEVQVLYGRQAKVYKGAYDEKFFYYTATHNIKEDLKLEGKRVILNINRLDKRKRVDLLLESFSMLEGENIVLVIGGTGSEEKNLKALADNLKITNRVIFLGFVEENKLLDYYASCDLFVHLNWAEYAITVYEALAMGCKVLCTTEMDFDDVLLQYGQIFLTEPNVNDLVHNLIISLENESNNKIPKELLKEYTWEKYFSKIHRHLIGTI